MGSEDLGVFSQDLDGLAIDGVEVGTWTHGRHDVFWPGLAKALFRSETLFYNLLALFAEADGGASICCERGKADGEPLFLEGRDELC